MIPYVPPPEEQIGLTEYLYARMKNPIRVEILHDDDGNYRVLDDKGNLIQAGWIAKGGTADQRNRRVMVNLREGSQIAFSERAAIQRFADLLTFDSTKPQVTLSGVIIPEKKVYEGVLITSVSFVWVEIVEMLKGDWSKAYEMSPQVWEEVVAGAYKRAGYDEVTLTPRSGDHGRDLIAVKKGIGAIKILGSVKAYNPGLLVSKEQVHALVGVVSLDPAATKGILTTTSDFAPQMLRDKNLAQVIPDKIELMNGERLRLWLIELLAKK
ncbi:restriction endonuclease [Mesorhizobium sp. M0589]|uniref:restriction endonuclease n=1 Tax=Mesorhizobium sp. M0589 TaxID=2956965 RepID=UPI003339C196